MRDQQSAHPRTRQSLWLREHARWAMLLLLVLSGILMPISQDASIFFPVASAHGLGTQSTKPTPNRFNPHADATSVAPPAGFGKGKTANAPAGPPQSLKRAGSFSMQPGRLALSADHATTFKGSDGRLEIDVPAGAVTGDDLAAAGGYISLRISQIAPASGSSAGGSGIVSFGTYLVQAVDAQGVLLPHGLRQPATLKLHYATRESALDLSHAVAVFNTQLPDGTDPDLAPLTFAVQVQQPGRLTGGNVDVAPPGSAPTMANSHFGPYSSQAATLDTASQSLIVPLTLKDPSNTNSFDTDAAVATFGKPDPFNVDLNAGSLTSGIPIDVPSGPDGLTPPVTLSYSSAGVSEQHNPQGAAGWAGEGWTLDMGAISWAEHNSNASCTSGCGNGWEDTWELSDPFGTSVELIPPNIQVATYYDDTGNSITASPVRWHTTPDNYAKVYSYTSTLTLPDGAGVHPPCFRVFLTNGIMEEFGCTSDSLQYYYTPGMGDYIASWHLDLITDPQGNQIHLKYASDVEQKSVSGVNHPYDRDTVLSTIEWDSPTCQNASTACAIGGTAPNKWAPLMQVSFTAGHAPTHPTNTLTGCNTGTNLRCDDPLDLSTTICKAGYTTKGLPAPDVQSTSVLNDVVVQVRGSAAGSWNSLRDYQFTYQRSAPSQVGAGEVYDPVTGMCESVAGSLLLTKLVEVGDDLTTALPTHTFGYTAVPQYYEDDVYHPHTLPGGATNCGPSFNTGNGSGCLLWNQSFDGNSYYLSTADNGMGLHQTFSWANARNNTHGVNGGGSNNEIPLYCNGLSAADQKVYPCNEADDQNWSHAVLTQQKGDVVRASTDGDTTISSTSTYAYTLTALPNRACSDCVAGMYWGNQNNGDYLDYYDAKFMGFAEADVANPDGSFVKHKYLSTEGYGLYDATVPCLAYILPCHVSPWWDIGNAGHGHEYETDYYDIGGTTLLKKETAQYQLVCPAGGVAGSPSWSTTLNGNPYTYTWDGMLVAALDHGNPVADCDVQTTSTDSTMVNGASDPFYAPHSSASYLYDSVGRVTDQTTGVDTGLEAQYFANSSLTGDPALTRLDATVNNSWGTGSPFPGIGPNGFSVRWTGYVQPQYSGTYTFYTDSDDGARLWVNGTELVNNWTNHGLTENSGTIALTAGQLYPITLEYYDYTSTATIQLYWSEASQPKQIIPATALFTRADGGGGTAYGSVPAVVTHTDYIQNNGLTATSTGVTGHYLLTFPAYVYTRDGGNTVHYACGQVSYDGAGYATGQQSSLTLGEAMTGDQYTSCGNAGQ